MKDPITEICKCLESEGHKYKINNNLITLNKKNVARIEIEPNGSSGFHFGFHVLVFRKNEFGGYATDRHNGPYAPKTYQHINFRDCITVEKVMEVINYFFALPPVEKTKSKPKDDKNFIYQNAFARELIDRSEYARIISLAKSDQDICRLTMRFLSITILKSYMIIHWPTLTHKRFVKIIADSMSPDFDPDKYIDMFIKLDGDLQNHQSAVWDLENPGFIAFDIKTSCLKKNLKYSSLEIGKLEINNVCP